MGVPSHPPIVWIFHERNHLFWGTPIYANPPYIPCMYIYIYICTHIPYIMIMFIFMLDIPYYD